MTIPVCGGNESPIEFWRRIGWECRLSHVLEWNYITMLEVEDFAIVHSGNSYIGVHKPCTYTFSKPSRSPAYPNLARCFCEKYTKVPDIIAVTLRLLNP